MGDLQDLELDIKCLEQIVEDYENEKILSQTKRVELQGELVNNTSKITTATLASTESRNNPNSLSNTSVESTAVKPIVHQNNPSTNQPSTKNATASSSNPGSIYNPSSVNPPNPSSNTPSNLSSLNPPTLNLQSGVLATNPNASRLVFNSAASSNRTPAGIESMNGKRVFRDLYRLQGRSFNAFSKKSSFSKKYPALLNSETNILTTFEQRESKNRPTLDAALREYYLKRHTPYNLIKPHYKAEGVIYCFPSVQKLPESVRSIVQLSHTAQYGCFRFLLNEVKITVGDLNGYSKGVSICLFDTNGVNCSKNYIIADGERYSRNNFHSDVKFTNPQLNGAFCNMNRKHFFKITRRASDRSNDFIYFVIHFYDNVCYDTFLDPEVLARNRRLLDYNSFWPSIRDYGDDYYSEDDEYDSYGGYRYDSEEAEEDDYYCDDWDYPINKSITPMTFISLFRSSVENSLVKCKSEPKYSHLNANIATMTEEEIEKELDKIYDFKNAKVLEAFNTSKENAGIQAGTQEISLSCPYTLQLMRYPAKGIRCTHVQCFDLKTFFELAKNRDRMSCAYCSNIYRSNELTLDLSFMTALAQSNGKTEVYIESNGTFSFQKPDTIDGIDIDSREEATPDSIEAQTATTEPVETVGDSPTEDIVVQSIVHHQKKRKLEEDLIITSVEVEDDDCVIVL